MGVGDELQVDEKTPHSTHAFRWRCTIVCIIVRTFCCFSMGIVASRK